MSNDLISATKRRAAAREKRRKTLSLEPQPQPLDEATEPSEDGASSLRDDSVSDFAGATRSRSGRVTFGLGALIGAAAGATAANLASRRKDVISGVVRIDLLKRVELLSIKLRLQRAAEDRLR